MVSRAYDQSKASDAGGYKNNRPGDRTHRLAAGALQDRAHRRHSGRRPQRPHQVLPPRQAGALRRRQGPGRPLLAISKAFLIVSASCFTSFTI